VADARTSQWRPASVHAARITSTKPVGAWTSTIGVVATSAAVATAPERLAPADRARPAAAAARSGTNATCTSDTNVSSCMSAIGHANDSSAVSGYREQQRLRSETSRWPLCTHIAAVVRWYVSAS
jgi:hypothetical protein